MKTRKRLTKVLSSGAAHLSVRLLLVAVCVAPAFAQTDSTRQPIDSLLGTRDTAIAPERWTKLGADAEKVLEAIVADPSALPSRRARALEGLAQIKGRDAEVLLHSVAFSESEPVVLRMAAIRGLGRILSTRELMTELQPLLKNASAPGVRGTAAEVLSLSSAGSIEARKQGAKESPGWRARFLKPESASPSPAPSPGTSSPVAQPQNQSRALTSGAPSTAVVIEPSSTSEQIIDLGTVNVPTSNLSCRVTFQVPVGTLSLDVFGTGVSDPTARIVIYRIDSPDGRLYDYASASTSPMKVVASQQSGSFSIVVPNSPSLAFSPGSWTITLLANKATTAAVKAIMKSGTSPNAGVLDFNLFFVGLSNLSAATAPSDPDFQVTMSQIRGIYAQVGIRLGKLHYLDITGDAATQYGDLNDANLGALVQLSSADGAQENAMNLFFVRTITGGALGGFVILGETAGLPGVPARGTTASGVAISMTDFGHPGNEIAIICGHEMGHWLGLFHPTESGGTAFDPLPDTPQCDAATHDANRNGIVEASECVGFGAENLMFWANDPSILQGFLSPNQGFVMVRNPLVTDVNLLEVTSVAQLGSGTVRLQGVGVPNAIHTVQSSTALTSAFSVLGTTTADGAGLWQYDDASAQGQQSRFYKVTFP